MNDKLIVTTTNQLSVPISFIGRPVTSAD